MNRHAKQPVVGLLIRVFDVLGRNDSDEPYFNQDILVLMDAPARFLDTIEAQVPAELEVHLILDNYGTHKTALIRKWLLKRPRFRVHYTPTCGSWLNLVERWFAELTNKRIRRGVFRSVRELESAIREYIEIHNEDQKPFIWPRSADQILDSMARYARRTLTSHPSGITSRINGTGDWCSPIGGVPMCSMRSRGLGRNSFRVNIQ